MSDVKESAPKHTAGPWRYESNSDNHVVRMGPALGNKGVNECQHIIEYDHGCYVNADGEEARQWREAEANARLIAAAPDLLEALQCAVNSIEAMRPTFSQVKDEGHAFHDQVLDAARTAIAKATGSDQ